ncbi:MAG: hypothetical protein ACOCVH_02535 [Verrucomicrobiota bacterium]
MLPAGSGQVFAGCHPRPDPDFIRIESGGILPFDPKDFPEEFTRDIFVSTNMLEEIWQIALTTNLNTQTNTFIWIDTEATEHPSRFYDCWTLHDSDGDGLSDGRERRLHGTDPLDSDSDNDGMPDGWEIKYGLDPLTHDDPEADYDGDNYMNVYECKHDSDPLSPTNIPAPTVVVTNGATTIQAAINSCTTDYGIVLVKAGTYTNSGNRDIDLDGKRILVLSEEGPESTIIDCENAGRGFHLHSSETRRSVISGFTIKNGNSFATNLWEMEGGGIMCDDSSATILDCTIEQNKAYMEGGGIYVKSGGPELRNCRLTQNYAGNFGGGIGCGTNCALLVSGGLVSNNEAGDIGGGIYCRSSSSPQFVGSSIVSNSSSAGGGFLFGHDIGRIQRVYPGLELGYRQRGRRNILRLIIGPGHIQQPYHLQCCRFCRRWTVCE